MQAKMEKLLRLVPTPGSVWKTIVPQDLYPTRDGLFDMLEDRRTGYVMVLAIAEVDKSDFDQRKLHAYEFFDVLVVMNAKIGWIPYTNLDIWRKAFSFVHC